MAVAAKSRMRPVFAVVPGRGWLSNNRHAQYINLKLNNIYYGTAIA